MKVKSESEVAQSCPTLNDPMDCTLLGSSLHGIFQARVLEWGAIAFSISVPRFILFGFFSPSPTFHNLFHNIPKSPLGGSSVFQTTSSILAKIDHYHCKIHICFKPQRSMPLCTYSHKEKSTEYFNIQLPYKNAEILSASKSIMC